MSGALDHCQLGMVQLAHQRRRRSQRYRAIFAAPDQQSWNMRDRRQQPLDFIQVTAPSPDAREHMLEGSARAQGAIVPLESAICYAARIAVHAPQEIRMGETKSWSGAT